MRWRLSLIWGPAGWWMRAGRASHHRRSFVEDHWSPGVSRMLFRTFDQFPVDHWPSRFTVVSAEAIAALAGAWCVLIGIDSPSLDPETSKTMDAHLAMPADMRILEGLVLDHVPPGDYELIALAARAGRPGCFARPRRAEGVGSGLEVASHL